MSRNQQSARRREPYLSGIRNSKATSMIYFEIPMEKYLSYNPPKVIVRR